MHLASAHSRAHHHASSSSLLPRSPPPPPPPPTHSPSPPLPRAPACRVQAPEPWPPLPPRHARPHHAAAGPPPPPAGSAAAGKRDIPSHLACPPTCAAHPHTRRVDLGDFRSCWCCCCRQPGSYAPKAREPWQQLQHRLGCGRAVPRGDGGHCGVDAQGLRAQHAVQLDAAHVMACSTWPHGIRPHM
jgi:hypothetical protein